MPLVTDEHAPPMLWVLSLARLSLAKLSLCEGALLQDRYDNPEGGRKGRRSARVLLSDSLFISVYECVAQVAVAGAALSGVRWSLLAEEFCHSHRWQGSRQGWEYKGVCRPGPRERWGRLSGLHDLECGGLSGDFVLGPTSDPAGGRTLYWRTSKLIDLGFIRLL